MGRRALPIALFVALVLAAMALALRVIVDGRAEAGAGMGAGAGGAHPASELLPLLFAAAGLCTAGLLRQRAPAGAWLATVSVGGIAALVILGGVRSLLPVTALSLWPWLVVVAVAGLLGAAGIAAAYAGREAIRDAGHSTPTWRAAWRAVLLLGLAVVAVSGGLVVTGVFAAPMLAADLPSSDLPPLRVSARLAAGFIAVTTLAGIWRDLGGPFGRARARSANVRDLPRAIGEELLPNATAARRRGRDEERARIAADLHALVLPDLRRAARAAEDAEAAEAALAGAGRDGAGLAASAARGRPVAADLRSAVDGVERLMHQRQSVVLEEYGLVAGLEWLAEQAQQRGAIVVDVELEGPDVGNPAAVAPPIARAAFRVAMLALDNVVRHAGASRALVRLDVESGRGRLTIVDDGTGIEDAAAARSGRGLIDMRTAATEIGASVTFERRDGRTAVEFAWASAGANAEDPATGTADLTTRPPAPHA